MTENDRWGGLDHGKVIAALLVVAIHTAPLASLDADLDFLLTGILARTAVPFFLMITGYFLLPSYLFESSGNYLAIWRFIKKMLLLYGLASMIYFPVNIYAGRLQGIDLPDLLRMLIFDGSFYHLWYLPAAVLGVLFLVFIGRRLPFKLVFMIALILYGLGLLGDSYYGFIAGNSLLNKIYQAMFQVFSYTRNGIFYTPVFLAMGAGLKIKNSSCPTVGIAAGFIISTVLLFWEGMTLHYLGVQRHNSMYIALLPTMYFLFQMILRLDISPKRSLRAISVWVYIIHPLFIILLRVMAKFTHTEQIFIANSIMHYLTVCFLSFAFAVAMQNFLPDNAASRIKYHSSATEKVTDKTGRAWIEIDRNNLQKNVRALQSLLPANCQLMPAVKANAYGHGAVVIAEELNRLGINSFCVATISEGIELRRNGIKGDILILGYTYPKQIALLHKYNLTQTVLDSSYARLLNSCGQKIKVHLKIDTGMHRLGERAESIDDIEKMFHMTNLVIDGAFTHLCVAEAKTTPGREYTLKQIYSFFNTVNVLKKRGCDCKKVHLLASYGLLNYPEYAGDYARVGIALYGVLSDHADVANCPINLLPILSVKARVAITKDLYAGEAAGYGLQYVAESKRKIAVLSIGYADGIPRSLSCGNGQVLLHGTAAPIIGRICMDQMLVDITNIPDVQSGDIAVVIGRSGEREISVYDLAEASNTITNEVLSRLGSRLERMLC